MAEITVKIIRRVITPPTRTPQGMVSLVRVTYSTSQLPPEVVSFDGENYSKELEREGIKKRVEDRLGLEPIPDEEFILEGL